jgi:hypothetical protein
VAGQLWQQMSEEEKKPYEEAYQREKAIYSEEMIGYLELHP